MVAALSAIECDRVDCNGSKKDCDYHAPSAKSQCELMPLEWGDFCNYELNFIDERYKNLVIVYNNFCKHFAPLANGRKFCLNHSILWQICFIYANDLKPVRKFHAVEGGCDRNRRAAFIARLIALHRPIYIEDVTPDNRQGLLNDLGFQLNEYFALIALSNFLELPSELFSMEKMEKVILGVIFIFGHRDAQPEAIVCIARLITALNQELEHSRDLEKKLRVAMERAEAAEYEVKILSGRLSTRE